MFELMIIIHLKWGIKQKTDVKRAFEFKCSYIMQAIFMTIKRPLHEHTYAQVNHAIYIND